MTLKNHTKKSMTQEKFEQAIVQDCKFEGVLLIRLKDWANTYSIPIAEYRFSKALENLKITGIHLSNSGTEILSGDGKVIKFVPATNCVTGPHYPLILVKDGTSEFVYVIVSTERFYLTSFERTYNGITLRYDFKKDNNFFNGDPSITLKKDDVTLKFSIGDKVTSRIPLLEDQLLKLNLTNKITPKEVFDLVRPYVKDEDIPMNVSLIQAHTLYEYLIWKVSIKAGLCTMYQKCIRDTNDVSKCNEFFEIDEKAFCYETDTTLYVSKNGCFKFETYDNPDNPFETFKKCKNKLEEFRNEMKHLLTSSD